MPECSLAGHSMPGKINARLINAAIASRDLKRSEDTWILCGYDGIYRKPSAIRALIVVQ